MHWHVSHLLTHTLPHSDTRTFPCLLAHPHSQICWYIFFQSDSYSFTCWHTHSQSLACTHSHTHWHGHFTLADTCTFSETHTHIPTISDTDSGTHDLTLAEPSRQTLTDTHTAAYTLSHSGTRSHSRWHITFKHSLTHTITYSLTRTHSHAHDPTLTRWSWHRLTRPSLLHWFPRVVDAEPSPPSPWTLASPSAHRRRHLGSTTGSGLAARPTRGPVRTRTHGHACETRFEMRRDRRDKRMWLLES